MLNQNINYQDQTWTVTAVQQDFDGDTISFELSRPETTIEVFVADLED